MGTTESTKALLKRLAIKHIFGRIVGICALLVLPVSIILGVLYCTEGGWDLGDEVEDVYDAFERSVHMIIFGGTH